MFSCHSDTGSLSVIPDLPCRQPGWWTSEVPMCVQRSFCSSVKLLSASDLSVLFSVGGSRCFCVSERYVSEVRSDPRSPDPSCPWQTEGSEYFELPQIISRTLRLLPHCRSTARIRRSGTRNFRKDTCPLSRESQNLFVTGYPERIPCYAASAMLSDS